MAQAAKGTATSLSAIFPVEETQKAAKRVHDAIDDCQREFDCLRGFISDNANLINLVQRLPDELHHHVMVPFGKGAFFPGQLIHTNEFLVLLGEGYYAERTAKQTVEILKRRGKGLESQVNSLKTMIQDLKAEASFFDATAAEAAEGLVEIIEDYVEESPSVEVLPQTGPPRPDSTLLKVDSARVADEDEEYARIMSRLDELEKEELVAESATVHEGNEQVVENFAQATSQLSLNQDRQSSEEHQLRSSSQQFKDEYSSAKEFSTKDQPYFFDQIEGLTVQTAPKDESLSGNSLADSISNSPTGKALMLPEARENFQAASTSNNQASDQISDKPGKDSLKAFTGSIIERAHNLKTRAQDQFAAPSLSLAAQPSKPVSRFKMQRR